MKTVGLEVELKLNLPSSCDETNQAARLAIGGASGSSPVQRASTQFVEERKLSAFFAVFSRHAALDAKPCGSPKEVQTVSHRPLWEFF